jgi:MATE family multidrug resistance protein
VNKEILKLAIPNIVSNITIPLLGIIDLALMGHMESEKYIGAIALGTMIFNVLYWAFAFLRMGTSGFTAQAFGEKNKQEQALNLFRSTLTAFIGASLLILFQIPIEFLSFKLIGGGQEVEQLAREYFYIRIWAAPATISLFAFNGWYLGMQNARVPMIIALVINVLNILFNLLFVFGFGMKSEGVALGTLLAQYSGFATALFYLKKDFNWVFSILAMESNHSTE